jgi:predicted NAD/FAD-binding protein
MYAFPNLGKIYSTITSSLGAAVHTSRPVARVVHHARGVTVTDTKGAVVEFDDIVMACSAETCLKVTRADV